MSCAVHSTLAAGVGYNTLELKVNYVRSVSTDQHVLTASGSVIHTGRTTATAEGSVRDVQDRLIAHATTMFLILGTTGQVCAQILFAPLRTSRLGACDPSRL